MEQWRKQYFVPGSNLRGGLMAGPTGNEFLTKSRAPTVTFTAESETVSFVKYNISTYSQPVQFGLVVDYMNSNWIYRVGLFDTGTNMFLAYSKLTYATKASGTWTTIVSGLPEGSCMTTLNGLILVASGNVVKEYDLVGSSFNLVRTSPAISTGTIRAMAYSFETGLNLFMTEIKTTYGPSVTYGKIILADFATFSVLATWRGQIPSPDGANPQLFSINETLYFQNSLLSSGPLMFQFTQDVSGSIHSVIPLDSLDDIETFSIMGATLSNFGNVLTGAVTRKNGSRMLVYMLGDGEFTTGKNYFIDTYAGDGMGQMVYVSGYVWYICANNVYIAKETSYLNLGDYNPDIMNPGTPLTGIDNAQVQMSSNSPYSLSLRGKALDLNLSGGSKKITSGSQINMTMTSGDMSVSIPFVVSQVSRVLDVNGASSQITAYSKWMSMLAEWESDSFYDYWSQSKASGKASDLTGMVPWSGKWEATGDLHHLTDANAHGILYSTERATPGNYVRGKFIIHTYIEDYYVGKVGLVVNLYQETIADAAKRLKKDVALTTQADCISKAIIVRTEGGWAGIYLYTKIAGVETLKAIDNIDFRAPYETWFWLSAKFVNSNLTIRYALDSNMVWSEIYNKTLSFPIDYRWNMEYGRAGIYGMNSSGAGAPSVCAPLQDTGKALGVISSGDMPGTGGTIKIDDEIITYTGRAERGDTYINYPTTGMSVIFGQLIEETGPTGAQGLSYDIHATAVRQPTKLTGTQYVNAVSVYLTKVGSPLDGVKVSIVDPGPAFGALGNERASAVVMADKISPGGGYVTFNFSTRVQMYSTDVIQIQKIRGTAGCDTNNYYRVNSCPTTPPYYAGVFDDSVDIWGVNAWTAQYQIWTDPVTDPSRASVCVSGHPSNTTADYYTNSVLTVVSGTGKGLSTQILGCNSLAGGKFVFYVDRDISNFIDATSKVYVFYALTGLTRTNPVNHTTNVYNLYSPISLFEVADFAYFSDEIDINLEDIVRKIARHAGVTSFSGKHLMGGFENPSIIPLVGSPAIQKRFMVFDLEYGALGTTDTINIRFWMNTNTADPATDMCLSITRDAVNLWSGSTLRSSVPGMGAGYVPLRISLFNNYLSIWRGEEYIHTFVIDPADLTKTGTYFKITGTFNQPIVVSVPDACMRVDNYALDMGKTALSLIQQIIGNRRFYIQDGLNGLTIFRTRTCQNDSSTPYDRAISGTISDAEPPYTRVMLEGGEIVEAYDETNMHAYGNIFHRETINEIFTVEDASDFASLYLAEAGASLTPVQFTGAIMPTLRPNDTLMVKSPAYDPAIGTQIKEVIADTISYQISLTNQAAVFDMSVNGRAK
jgi:hypothetical protein